jgi:hypothetical protein
LDSWEIDLLKDRFCGLGSFGSSEQAFIHTNSADEDCGYCFLSYRDDCVSGMPLAEKALETFVYHYYRSQQNFTFTYKLSKQNFHYSG